MSGGGGGNEACLFEGKAFSFVVSVRPIGGSAQAGSCKFLIYEQRPAFAFLWLRIKFRFRMSLGPRFLWAVFDRHFETLNFLNLFLRKNTIYPC